MCGIAGLVTKGAGEHKDYLKKMVNSLVHRGPDGEGIHIFENCALGHRRLSIVDLSTGAQPMIADDGKLGIVFNGEIYGYKEIRGKLDYPYKTTSDTEVILALYKKYGTALLQHLPGIFAFAIWDDKERRLFCARDRFGEKPFYYAIGKNGEFVFASEIKAILATNLIKPILRIESVAHFLQKLYVDPRYTIYENIFTLPPAHSLEFKDGKIKTDRYWNFPEINTSITLDEAVPEFKRLFYKAVEKQLVADVPVGAFLSGGLDSSTVVAVASSFKKNLKTFAFGFRDSINELPFAKAVAQKYSTDHIELWDDGEPLGDLLFKMVDIYDEPFADSSNIPTYLISKLAKKYTTVVLTGDGGDELLGGYGAYRVFAQMEKGGNKLLASDPIFFLSRVLAKFPGFGRGLMYRSLGAKYAAEFNSAVIARLNQDKIIKDKELIGLGLSQANISRDHLSSWTVGKPLEDAMRTDIENYMPGDILVKTDRASMANGLELRAPFLDVDFASFCLAMPAKLKITKDADKLILRQALGDLWPTPLKKRGKQGFGAPINKWLRERSVVQLKREYLDNKRSKIFTIIKFESAQEICKKNNYKTWILLSLALWMEKHNFEI